MNFENLLSYQKADAEYKSRKKQIAADPNYKRMRLAKEQFDNAKKKCADSEALAESVMNAYNEANAYLERNAAKIEELCSQLNEGNLSDNEEAEIIEKLNVLRNELAEWERKVATLKANADKAISEYSAAQKSGQGARAEYQAAKKAYEEITSGSEAELKRLEKERAEARVSVDEKLLELYDTISIENKAITNIVVPMMGDEKTAICGGCGMSLSTSDKDDLLGKGYIRCENCHRVIYKK